MSADSRYSIWWRPGGPGGLVELWNPGKSPFTGECLYRTLDFVVAEALLRSLREMVDVGGATLADLRLAIPGIVTKPPRFGGECVVEDCGEYHAAGSIYCISHAAAAVAAVAEPQKGPPCKAPGCGENLVVLGSAYCPEHCHKLTKEAANICQHKDCWETREIGTAYCPQHLPDAAGETSVETKDPINPPHYTSLKHEPIDAIEDWQQYWPSGVIFHLGNATKYIARAGLKGRTLEDLKKAQWYLNRAIKVLEG